MKVKYKVFSNLYQDSVSLMQISAQISKLPGIQQASVVMGTPNNLEQLRDAGLGNEINASPNDLVIAVMGEEDICNEALVLAQQRLTSKPDDETDSGIKTPEKVSLEMALESRTRSQPGTHFCTGRLRRRRSNESVKPRNERDDVQR